MLGVSFEALPVSSLLSWYTRSQRSFPWRSAPHPYNVWVCEVMSQQTTLQVVLPYYKRFLAELPSVQHLAEAKEEHLRRLWQGLGYYSRVRNLHRGAQYILQDLSGQYPQTQAEWMQVPGCGPYTSAVIASVCFGEPVACLDGNVMRVLSRFRLIGSELHRPASRKALQSALNRVISVDRPGDFNQAMMELGATVCRPRQTECLKCPLASDCRAFQAGLQASYPTPKPRKEFCDVNLLATVYLSPDGAKVGVAARKSGFLARTSGFPLSILPVDTEAESPFDRASFAAGIKGLRILKGTIRHTITNHRIFLHVGLQHGQSQSFFSEQADELLFVEKDLLAATLATSLDRKIWRLANSEMTDICERTADNEV